MDTLARVKELADEQHITLYRLAQLSGVNYSTIKATSRKKGQLSVDTIELVCVGLGITIQEFFSVGHICTAAKVQSIEVI